MKIANIFGGNPDRVPLGKRPEPADVSPLETSKTGALPASTGPTRSAAALREILAKYDVTRISPAQFSEMVQSLYQAGAISQQEFQELAAVRTDLDATGAEPDEPINLLELYRDKVRLAQRQADDPDPAVRPQMAPLLSRLDWLEKLSSMHSQPDSLGLNALA